MCELLFLLFLLQNLRLYKWVYLLNRKLFKGFDIVLLSRMEINRFKISDLGKGIHRSLNLFLPDF